MLINGFASHGEDGAGLEAHGHWRSVVTEIVEEFFEILRGCLRGSLAHEGAFWRQPLGPTWVFLPWDTVPKLEQLHGSMREGSDPSVLCLQGSLLHLECSKIGMVVDTALSKEGDVLEAVVVLDNMAKVGVTFTTNILKSLDFKTWLGCIFGAAFRVHLAMIEDRLEPGEILVVVSNDDLKVLSVPGDG